MIEILAHPAFWFIAGFILIIAEIFTLTFILLWLGIGAIISGIVAILVPSLAVQLLVFSLASLLLLIFTRPLTRRWRKGTPNVKSGVYALIGKEGITVEEIQDGGSGTVKVGGEIWRATSEEKLIPKGAAIEVVDVEGVTLKVKSLGG